MVNTFEQPNLATGWGIRDLAIVDGLIYGGNETHFFSFDPATETWNILFTSSFGIVRGLAFDGFHFWTKSFAGALYEFDISGNIIDTHCPIEATSTYGIAYENRRDYLYLFSQGDAVFYEFDLTGSFTGETWDVSSAQNGGIAGGAFYDKNNLVPGLPVLGFTIQGQPDIFAAVEVDLPIQYANDVGVSCITLPGKIVHYDSTEPVMFRIKNYGANPQSNIPWQIVNSNYYGADTVNGIYQSTLLPGETVKVHADSIHFSQWDYYYLEICTRLGGDDFNTNNCKTKDIASVLPNYICASTNTEDEYIANVLFGHINNSSGWQGNVADYTYLSTAINPGLSETILITNGNAWANDKVTCWVDWDQDIHFDYNQNSVEEFVLNNVGGSGEFFEGIIEAPPGTANGVYRMRIRMTYNHDPIPYGASTYGEIEDYSIIVCDPLLNDVGVVSIDMGTFFFPKVVTPKVTVKNWGTESQPFNVTLTIGAYTSTMSVAVLANEQSKQITFDYWVTDAGSYTAEVCTELIGDENLSNDCQSIEINVVNGRYAYGFKYGGGQRCLVAFDLNNPEDMFTIAPSHSSNAVLCACWAENLLWGFAMFGKLYSINPESGDMTFIGPTSASRGIAYDGSILFGSSGTHLFEIDPATGQDSLIGAMGNYGYMGGISCDAGGNMYGFDTGDDNFYTINKITGIATVIGPLGYNFSGEQDMSFDKETNICYISGYSSNALKGLFTVDVSTGAATLIYNYQDEDKIYGFAIPEIPMPGGPPPEDFVATYIEGQGVECSWSYASPKECIEDNDGKINGRYQKSLLGFSVYRDYKLLNPMLLPDSVCEYLDTLNIPGQYIYFVKAVYPDGLSDPGNLVEVIIPGVVIQVEPSSLEETHDPAPMITTQTLTIANTGSDTLNWEITGIYKSTINAGDSTVYWLSLNITSGSLTAGQSIDIEVTFNSDGLAQGIYYADIEIASNTISTPVVLVPVTLHVVADTLLAPPTNLTATIRNGNDVLLAWQAPEGTKNMKGSNSYSNVLQGYNVYRNDVKIASTIPETQYLDENLPAGYYEYYVTAVYDEGESTPSNSGTILITGLEEFNSFLEIFPNPADESLSIIANQELTQLKIFNSFGEVVFLRSPSVKKLQINTSGFPPGIYILRLETRQGTATRKLIIK